MTLTGLARIDPLDAEARTELLAALNGCVVGDALLRAAIVAAPPDGLAWFGCRGGLAFALEVLDGAPLRLSAADTGRAVAALEAAEPVLRALETALGIELEPEALDDAEQTGALRVVRVTLQSALTLYLSVPQSLALTPTPAPFAPGLLDHVPLPVTLSLTGPRVAPIDAADLGPGDLVLLGPGPLAATLDVPGQTRLPGHFDPAFRRFHPVTALRDQQESTR